MREILLGATKRHTSNEILHLFYTPDWPRSRVATLAELVDSAALNGDAVAMGILQRAAHELAILGASVRSQLWEPGDEVFVAYIGGVFRSQLVLEHFRQRMELDEGTRCVPPRYGPAIGALLEAYRAAQLPISDIRRGG